MRGRARILLAVIALSAAGCGRETRCARPPVLMLHGYGGGAASFDRLIEALRGAGWARRDLVALDLPGGKTIEAWGTLAAAEAARMHGRSGCRVGLVGYSQGGLAARWAAGPGGAGPLLRAVVTIGAPHHGTPIAEACEEPACLQMRAGSAFLEALDRGADAGSIPALSIASPTDRVVPAAGARVAGARNVSVCCPPHNRLLLHEGVIHAVRDALSAPEGKGR